MIHSLETWTSLKEVVFKCYEAVKQQYSLKHIMTSNDQFNDWLSQRDNDIFKYRNNVIAFNIKVIKRCKDLHDDSK